MSGPVSPENSDKIDVFRRVRACSFASVHGVSVVYLWSVHHFPRPLINYAPSQAARQSARLPPYYRVRPLRAVLSEANTVEAVDAATYLDEYAAT
jgi:hypothetical protein